MTDTRDRNEFLAAYAERAQVAAMEKRAEFKERLDTNPQHALQWAGDFAEREVYAERWLIVKGLAENPDNDLDWEAAYQKIREDCEYQLVNDFLRASSTSAFSNAMETHKRAAFAYFATQHLV